MNTMTCSGHEATHDGLDVRLVKLYMRRELRPLCRGCRSVLTRLGMDFTVTEPAVADRPRWLTNLRAKDMTGERAA